MPVYMVGNTVIELISPHQDISFSGDAKNCIGITAVCLEESSIFVNSFIEKKNFQGLLVPVYRNPVKRLV